MIRRPSFYRTRSRVERLAIALATAASLACGQSAGDHPPIYPVKGKVLYKGKPIGGGLVIYELDGADTKDSPNPLRATGRIEPNGVFRLMAFPGGEGVPEGRYRVGISSRPPRTEGGLFESAGSAKKGDPDVLRGRYADPKTSGLHADVVKDGANEPTFDLK